MPFDIDHYRPLAARLGLSRPEEDALLKALWHAVELLIDHSLTTYAQENAAQAPPEFPDQADDPLHLTQTFNTQEAP